MMDKIETQGTVTDAIRLCCWLGGWHKNVDRHGLDCRRLDTGRRSRLRDYRRPRIYAISDS